MMNNFCKSLIFIFLFWSCGQGLFGGDVGFHLVGIDVEGERWVSESLIKSESALKMDHAYTEPELQLALRRINRLPFILSAEFSLRKGTDYGTYVLVIEVVETKPLFVQYARHMEDRLGRDEYGGAERFSVTENELNVGGRLFLGKSSQIYLVAVLETRDGLSDSPPPVGVGYSHYNLFNRRIFFSFNFIYDKESSEEFEDFFGALTDEFDPDEFDPDDFDFEDPDEEPFTVRTTFAQEFWSPSINLSVPLRDQHWLVAELSYSDVKNNFGNDLEVGTRDRIREKRLELNLGWTRDTLNDQVIPTTGSRLEAGVRALELRSTFDLVFDNTLFEDEGGESDSAVTLPTEVLLFTLERSKTTNTFLTYGLDFYHPLNQQVSLFTQNEALLRISEQGDETRDPVKSYWNLSAGAVFNPLALKPLTHGDIRLELTVGRERERLDYRRRTLDYLNLSLPMRNAWGLIRLSFSYRDEKLDPIMFDNE